MSTPTVFLTQVLSVHKEEPGCGVQIEGKAKPQTSFESLINEIFGKESETLKRCFLKLRSDNELKTRCLWVSNIIKTLNMRYFPFG